MNAGDAVVSSGERAQGYVRIKHNNIPYSSTDQADLHFEARRGVSWNYARRLMVYSSSGFMMPHIPWSDLEGSLTRLLS